jgi:hypothetical protein
MTNKFAIEKKRHAGVYAFCLPGQINKKTFDPLYMDHWVYALATQEQNNYKRSERSITFNSLKGLTRSVYYNHFPHYGKSSRSAVQIVPGVQQFVGNLYNEKKYLMLQKFVFVN